MNKEKDHGYRLRSAKTTLKKTLNKWKAGKLEVDEKKLSYPRDRREALAHAIVKAREKDPSYKIPRKQKGGYLYGPSHEDDGILAYNQGAGQLLELEGGEFIMCKVVMDDDERYDLEGTPKEIVSRLQRMHGCKGFEEIRYAAKHGGKVSNETLVLSEEMPGIWEADHVPPGYDVAIHDIDVFKSGETEHKPFNKAERVEARQSKTILIEIRGGLPDEVYVPKGIKVEEVNLEEGQKHRKAKGGEISKGQAKFDKVMQEWKDGKLEHGTTNEIVPYPDRQDIALAIAFSEARKINPQFEGGKEREKMAEGGEVGYAVITEDEFDEKFKPKQNHLAEDAPFTGAMYETYGKELEYILTLANDPEQVHHVWTIIEGDTCDLYYVPGYHLVNRLGYLVTEEPWTEQYQPDVELEKFGDGGNPRKLGALSFKSRPGRPVVWQDDNVALIKNEVGNCYWIASKVTMSESGTCSIPFAQSGGLLPAELRMPLFEEPAKLLTEDGVEKHRDDNVVLKFNASKNCYTLEDLKGGDYISCFDYTKGDPRGRTKTPGEILEKELEKEPEEVAPLEIEYEPRGKRILQEIKFCKPKKNPVAIFNEWSSTTRLRKASLKRLKNYLLKPKGECYDLKVKVDGQERILKNTELTGTKLYFDNGDSIMMPEVKGRKRPVGLFMFQEGGTIDFAQAILHHLGGRQFIAMTGANNFIKDTKKNYLSFRIGRNASKANYVRITLDPSDTYTVMFGRIHGDKLTELDEYSMIYAEDLQRTFRDYTGFYTQLQQGGPLTEGMATLERITLSDGRDYFMDEKLKELRPVSAPWERVAMGDLADDDAGILKRAREKYQQRSTYQLNLEELRDDIRAQLDLCDVEDTPMVCEMKDTPTGYQLIEEAIVNKSVIEGLSISDAIRSIEQEYNPNLAND